MNEHISTVVEISGLVFASVACFLLTPCCTVERVLAGEWRTPQKRPVAPQNSHNSLNSLCFYSFRMLENKVGIWSNIENLLQNVLRELEQKKPQLDDLVRTADSLRDSPIKQKIPAKGKSRLNNLVRTAEKQFKLCLMSRPIQQQFLFNVQWPQQDCLKTMVKIWPTILGLTNFSWVL